ncbi:MAG: hypothetical protein ACTSUO_08820 [Candidatus Thorarchaeota archaeon]
MDTAKDARILILEDALRIINEIISNRKLKMHIDYAKIGTYLKTAGSLLYEVKFSYIDAPSLADLESTKKIVETIATLDEVYEKAISSGYKPTSPKELLAVSEMDYAFRTVESFPDKLRNKGDDPAYAVDIFVIEVSQVKQIEGSKNLSECRCSDGSRIWKISTNIADVKQGMKLACARLPPVEMMNVVSEAMFLGGEVLSEATPLGPLDNPPDSALDQARAQVLQITKRMT